MYDGAYVSFRLHQVRLKLIDNGTPIIANTQNVGVPPRPIRYKYMLGKNLLFREWTVGQKIEYATDVDESEDEESGVSIHTHKGKIEGVEGNKIVIKQQFGNFITYDLNQIKIKFEADY